eukprot:TRINITY_DN3151_c0_g1_i6.p1 TRINITY_DN3151_c0_g1~~TRINITY_DN3151_c0_g1_i6.p1  ORF type:complete len:900 (-),score=169.15 TRINITY_DN3151_c0_g1_i6:561-3260(-)
MTDIILREGWLFVQERGLPVLKNMELGWKFASWKRRWFRLTYTSFSYSEDFNRPTILAFELNGTRVEYPKVQRANHYRTNHYLRFQTASHTYTLCGATSSEVKEWFYDISDVIDYTIFMTQQNRFFEVSQPALPSRSEVYKVENYQFHLPKGSVFSPPGHFENRDHGIVLDIEIFPHPMESLGAQEIDAIRSYAEEYFAKKNGTIMKTNSSEHLKTGTMKGDVSLWRCWKVYGSTMENVASTGICLRKYLPPTGASSEIIIFNLVAPNNGSESIDLFYSVIESMCPQQCSFDLKAISEKVRGLKQDYDFYRWANESFRIRPFPRYHLDNVRKALEYSLDLKASLADSDFTLHFPDAVAVFANTLPGKSPQEAESIVLPYVAAFLDSGFDSAYTLEKWLEKRAASSSAQRQELDLAITKTLGFNPTKEFVCLSKMNPAMINNPGVAFDFNIPFFQRLIETGFLVSIMDPEASLSLFTLLLKQQSPVLHLASGQGISQLIADSHTLSAVIKSSYISVIISRLPKYSPFQLTTKGKTESSEGSTSAAPSNSKAPAIPETSQSANYDPSTKTVSGALSLKEGIKMKKRWAHLEMNNLVFTAEQNDSKQTEKVDLFQCTKIEGLVTQNQITLKTLSGDRILITPDKFSFGYWMHYLIYSGFYSGSKTPGFEDPFVYHMVGDEESVSSGQARSEKEQRSTRHTNPLSTLTNFVGNAVGNAVSTAANATAQAVRRTVDLQSQPLIYSKKANTSIPLQVRVIHQIVYVLHAKNLLQLCLSNNGLLSRIFETESFITYMLHHLSSADAQVLQVTLDIFVLMATDSSHRSQLVANGVLRNVLALFDDIRSNPTANAPSLTSIAKFLCHMASDESVKATYYEIKLKPKLDDIRAHAEDEELLEAVSLNTF